MHTWPGVKRHLLRVERRPNQPPAAAYHSALSSGIWEGAADSKVSAVVDPFLIYSFIYWRGSNSPLFIPWNKKKKNPTSATLTSDSLRSIRQVMTRTGVYKYMHLRHSINRTAERRSANREICKLLLSLCDRRATSWPCFNCGSFSLRETQHGST